jgi:hypothetical protein
MKEPCLTLGERWLDHYLAGITWIRCLTDRPNARADSGSDSDSTPETLIRVLQGVAIGRLDGAEYFRTGNLGKPALVSVPPPLSPETDYLLIGLNAETARSRFANLTTGGVVFEDPIWAFLAAHAVSLGLKDQRWLAVPRARDEEDLWKRVLLIASAIEESHYQPEDFFGPIEGWIPPSETPKFELLTVSTEQLTALRARGVQALKTSRPPKFFELYQAPATP